MRCLATRAQVWTPARVRDRRVAQLDQLARVDPLEGAWHGCSSPTAPVAITERTLSRLRTPVLARSTVEQRGAEVGGPGQCRSCARRTRNQPFASERWPVDRDTEALRAYVAVEARSPRRLRSAAHTAGDSLFTGRTSDVAPSDVRPGHFFSPDHRLHLLSVLGIIRLIVRTVGTPATAG